MKRILISQDTEKIERFKNDLQQGLDMAQVVWSEWKKVEYFDESYTLQQIFTSLENAKRAFLVKAVKAEFGESTRFSLNEAKVAELYVLNPTPELNQAIQAARDFFATSDTKPEFYTVQDDVVKVIEKHETAFIDRYSLYAETADQIKLYNLFQQFIKSVEEMNEFVGKHHLGIFFHKSHPFATARWLGWDGNKYEIEPRIFRKLKMLLSR